MAYKKPQLTPEEQIARVRLPKGNQVLCIIEQTLGGNKLRVRCQDDKVRMGRIPGKLRKRVWMREGDVIILEPWDIKGDQFGNAVWRYTAAQVGHLRRKGILTLEP